jgi:hypothetical protein
VRESERRAADSSKDAEIERMTGKSAGTQHVLGTGPARSGLPRRGRTQSLMGARRTAEAEDGQALVLAVVLMAVALALLGLVISMGFIQVAHHQAQMAADAGALAAADELYAGSNTATTAGQSFATANDPTATVAVTTPVGGDATKAQVAVTQTVQTFFSQFFGLGTVQVSASATAQSDINSAQVGDADITPDGCSGICNVTTGNFVGNGPWQVTFGNVDLQNCDGGTGIGCTLPDGYTSPEVVDLNGFNPGCIQQTIATIPDAQYTLTFELTGNPYQANSNYKFTGTVQIGSTTTPFFHYNNPYTVVSYDLVTVPFLATATTTPIEFCSTSYRSGLQDYAGPEIADINIQYPQTILVQ